ncbi:MAG: hypothetical protein WBM00_01205 [Solirubrobacterales bacterium]
MPKGVRTDRISARDVEVLGFIARFGIVPRTAVAKWAGTGRTVTLTRERRLREAELVEVRSGVGGQSKLLTCTRAGLRFSGHGDLRTARFSLATVWHESAVAELAAELERGGDRTLSEREILAEERAHGELVYSAELPGGRLHRADLIRAADGPSPEAIEVELAAKAATRLDELLRAWRRAVAEGRLGGVGYRCGPRIGRVVRRAVDRTRTASAISVEEL